LEDPVNLLEGAMVDRQKVEAILSCRFPGTPRDQLAAAVNALMGLPEEWDEVERPDWQQLVDRRDVYDVRVFRRREI
jgi:hypothetical protein